MYNNVLSVNNTGIFFGDRKALFILSKKKRNAWKFASQYVIVKCMRNEEEGRGLVPTPSPNDKQITPPPIPQINCIRTPFVMLTYSLFQFKNERFLRYSVVRYPDLPPGVLHWCTEDCLLSVNWCVHVSAQYWVIYIAIHPAGLRLIFNQIYIRKSRVYACENKVFYASENKSERICTVCCVLSCELING